MYTNKIKVKLNFGTNVVRRSTGSKIDLLNFYTENMVMRSTGSLQSLYNMVNYNIVLKGDQLVVQLTC